MKQTLRDVQIVRGFCFISCHLEPVSESLRTTCDMQVDKLQERCRNKFGIPTSS
jgi:hypothetical protein